MCLSLSKDDKKNGQYWLLINLVFIHQSIHFLSLSWSAPFPQKQVVDGEVRYQPSGSSKGRWQLTTRVRGQHQVVGGKRELRPVTKEWTTKQCLETKKADSRQWRGHNSTTDHQQEWQKQSTAVGGLQVRFPASFFWNRKIIWPKFHVIHHFFVWVRTSHLYLLPLTMALHPLPPVYTQDPLLFMVHGNQ